MNLNSWKLENSYADLPSKFYTSIKPSPVKAPELIIFNKKLAKSLDITLPHDDKKILARLFSGNDLPETLAPLHKLMLDINLATSQFLVMV